MIPDTRLPLPTVVPWSSVLFPFLPVIVGGGIGWALGEGMWQVLESRVNRITSAFNRSMQRLQEEFFLIRGGRWRPKENTDWAHLDGLQTCPHDPVCSDLEDSEVARDCERITTEIEGAYDKLRDNLHFSFIPNHEQKWTLIALTMGAVAGALSVPILAPVGASLAVKGVIGVLGGVAGFFAAGSRTIVRVRAD